MGTVHAGLIYGTRIKIGGGTNEDLYFQDSGIRLYDAGSRTMKFSKSGYATYSIGMQTSYIVLYTSGSRIALANNAYTLEFKNTGALRFPSVWSAPSGYQGDMTYNNATDRFVGYIGGSSNKWGHWLLTSGW